MAKAFEIKTGLDKLRCWAKGTKHHVDISCYPPVNGELILKSVDWVKPEGPTTAFSCCTPVIGNLYNQDCLKPMEPFAAHSFGLLAWLLQPWAILWITGNEQKDIWLKIWFPYLLIVIMIIMESPRETHKTSEGAIGWINNWITSTPSK